jgi:hypothetical protein
MKIKLKPSPFVEECVHEYSGDGYCSKCKQPSPARKEFDEKAKAKRLMCSHQFDSVGICVKCGKPQGSQNIVPMVLGLEKVPSSKPTLLRTERKYEEMPFGKHKGYPLSDIPTDYLRWAVGPKGLDDDGSGLYKSLEIELWDREDR